MQTKPFEIIYKMYSDHSTIGVGSVLYRMTKAFVATKNYGLLKEEDGKVIIETDQFSRLWPDLSIEIHRSWPPSKLGYVCVHACVCLSVCCVCLPVCVHTCSSVCVSKCVRVYACVWLCEYILVHVEATRQLLVSLFRCPPPFHDRV